MAKTTMVGASRGSGFEDSMNTSQPATPKIAHSPGFNPESGSLQITSQKLNGKNFLQRSKSVELVIRGRGKLGYLIGAAIKPEDGDPQCEVWDANNSIVMSWLVNSIIENIHNTCLYFTIAKELWDYLHLAYFDRDNSGQLYELRNQARLFNQGDKDVTTYFTYLYKLWQELDLFYSCIMECPTDWKRYREKLDKKRIYDFLAGLNNDLDEVRGRILGIKPLPMIEEVFAKVRREETRKRFMLGLEKPSTTPDSLAMVVR